MPKTWKGMSRIDVAPAHTRLSSGYSRQKTSLSDWKVCMSQSSSIRCSGRSTRGFSGEPYCYMSSRGIFDPGTWWLPAQACVSCLGGEVVITRNPKPGAVLTVLDDDEHLLGAQQMMRDDDNIPQCGSGAPTGIPNHMSIDCQGRCQTPPRDRYERPCRLLDEWCIQVSPLVP